ncbi:MAG: NAD(P)H-hydrate epimerase [Butyricicoccus sp.]
MRIVTTAQMKQIERRGDESGISYLQMMENAGTAAYRLLRERYPKSQRLVVYCGKGNNGGDGFVVARLAAQDGLDASVILVEGKPVTQDAITNFSRLPDTVSISEIGGDLPVGDVIVDALYGTGFHGTLRPSGALACQQMNQSGVPVVALDLPSGCYADSGDACPGAVHASLTVAFDSWKRIHQPASSLCGDCVLADIGIPEHCHDDLI